MTPSAATSAPPTLSVPPVSTPPAPTPATPTAAPATPSPSATPTTAPVPTPTSTLTPTPSPSPTPPPTPPPTATPATPATTPTATPPTVTPPTTPPPTTAPTDAYLAAFRTCPKVASCTNQEHEVRLATSSDGGNFTAFPNATPLGSGTPELIRRGGTIYVYNDNVVHRFDVANGTWRPPANVSFTNANGTAAIALNASAILDENGSIVLFHLFAQPGQDAGCGAFPLCTKTFRSATEVVGSDGTQFRVDAGNRGVVSTSNTASDPDVFAHPGGYAMLVSVGNGVRVLTSTELRGTYTHREYLTNTSGNTPAGHYDAATSRYWLYVQSGGGAAPMMVKRAIVASLDDPLPDEAFSVILQDRGAPSFATN